jgi:hypothetical protein
MRHEPSHVEATRSSQTSIEEEKASQAQNALPGAWKSGIQPAFALVNRPGT